MLETSGGTVGIAVIRESTKHLVPCQSIQPDSTLTFCYHIPVLVGVKIGSYNSRKLSRWIEDFSLSDEIVPSDSDPRFVVFS